MSFDVLQLLSTFYVPHLPVSKRNRDYFVFDLMLLLTVLGGGVCVGFTLTVPSKDQDSSLVSAGELESREKHLTCSL